MSLKPTLLPKRHKTVQYQIDLPSRKRREIIGLVGEDGTQRISYLKFFEDGAEAAGRSILAVPHAMMYIGSGKRQGRLTHNTYSSPSSSLSGNQNPVNSTPHIAHDSSPSAVQ